MSPWQVNVVYVNTHMCNVDAWLVEISFIYTDCQETEERVTDLAMAVSYSKVSENSLKSKEPLGKDLIFGFGS